jgi:hypothetical protein
MRSPEISAERICMPTAVERRTVDLSRFPKLVVIYLGMRVNRIRGFRMLVGFGPKISNSAAAAPDGLLLHEQVIYSIFPLHVGMRQYWRDLESLLAWTGSEPHRTWWRDFLRDSGGTGFWHETYFMQGGMEGIYDDIEQPIGLMKVAPIVPARGPMFGAAHRVGKQSSSEAVIPESELYR